MNSSSDDIVPSISMMNKNLLKTLGPGILFASTAIGVSHLVQSTRAGAIYGFGLLWAVVLANVFKYPFFEYGSRYANATGKSLIDGYKRLGSSALWMYLLITVGSMFFVSAAVTAVTAGFFDNLFSLHENLGIAPSLIAFVLLLVCGLILSVGKYRTLDALIKLVAAILLVTTLVAFLLTLAHGPVSLELSASQLFGPDVVDMAFVIALMGWMPTAVDMSAWNSLWTVERIEQTGYRPTLKETLFDFNLGYIISAVLAICFITMGAFLLYGSGQALPSRGAAFANTVITMYTDTIGTWSTVIIASAGFAIMFGTCIAVLDGYARALSRVVILLLPEKEAQSSRLKGFLYPTVIWALVGGALAIIVWRGAAIPALVDLATTISFLIAPFVAVANFRLVHYPYVSREFQPPVWLKLLSYLGILFLVAFSVYFVIK
jgi:Mn2+/Fe2+ NRAMP family transporter